MEREYEWHDHVSCIADATSATEQCCATRNSRLTALRRQLLNILLQERVASGAYNPLKYLQHASFNSQPQATYRVLKSLVTNDFALKVERLNAFIACSYPRESYSPAFKLFRNWHVAAENRSTPAKGTLGATAQSVDFRIERTVFEDEGLCPACQDETT